ncbi:MULTISPECIES: extracellular solute-binding protein [unclassified Actinomyces]|uniref:extracellular solute-binding protein n=1 Tax=unclassified Actinomyces TaxID=2609248 RepID=UPI002016A7BF|nr:MULTISPECIES: extracellular solute-binding protein [unclassified Actinomyces]MCL3777159.1 extracellular solute-binding protein [Actinomyces sp. AC-20-1]MCL3789017.1 extracellular solute-binding protein [Actinomyces sp. 187325]MCL3791372.1 extracellular solute-binding protein [Actinomyces sp. 186855]MCL3793917.1 extracellular solute-binding protein [Actinomyces sp. 217892]
MSSHASRIMLTRRHAIGGLLATGLAATLAACGGGTRPGGGASADGATVWFLTGGSEMTMRDSFDRWNEAHADQQITYEVFANDAYKEKIRTAVGSGNAPTLLYSWAGGTLVDYVSNDQVIDLTDLTAAAQERLIPSLLEIGKVDGKVYALPNNNTQPVLIYYNKEVFAAAGAEPPTTWDELMALIPVFTAAGYIPFAEAGASQWPYLMWIQYLTDRIGGPEVFNRVLAGEAGAWSDPAFTEALTKIQDMVRAGGLGDTYGSVDADSNADLALVHTGKAAMVLQGSWVYSNFLADAPDMVASGNLGYTTFPTVAGGKGDPSNVTGNPANYWSVTSSASEEARQAAIAYLNEEMLTDAYVAKCVEQGLIPGALNAEEAIKGSEFEDYLTFGYNLAKNAGHFQMSWDQALPSAQAQELLTNLSQIFLLSQTPQEFVEKMNATLA